MLSREVYCFIMNSISGIRKALIRFRSHWVQPGGKGRIVFFVLLLLRAAEASQALRREKVKKDLCADKNLIRNINGGSCLPYLKTFVGNRLLSMSAKWVWETTQYERLRESKSKKKKEKKRLTKTKQKQVPFHFLNGVFKINSRPPFTPKPICLPAVLNVTRAPNTNHACWGSRPLQSVDAQATTSCAYRTSLLGSLRFRLHQARTSVLVVAVVVVVVWKLMT